ncbi:MAG: phospholipase D-like domain-containing protein, partial [Prevotella sp.]|nr:phospholipase D-like domain-containing protein [Prevotella sp.]
MNYIRSVVALIIACSVSSLVYAQHGLNERADTLLVRQMMSGGITFSDDNSVVLLHTGREKFEDLFKAVADAKESIHMEYFNFRNDSVANLLFDRLADKAREGVEVRLLFDAFGNSSNNQPLKREHLERIRQSGIQIYEFDPLRFPWINHVFSRDHRKIVVIDGRIAYTGGMNVADYYILGTDEVGEWRDMHCRIEGTEVNTLQTIFAAIWLRVSGERLTDAKYFCGGAPAERFADLVQDTTATSGAKQVGIINREPRRSPKVIRRFYLDAINASQSNIKIINPYFTLSHRLKKAMKRAARRGVKVEIMLSVASDIPLTPDCGFYNAHKL